MSFLLEPSEIRRSYHLGQKEHISVFDYPRNRDPIIDYVPRPPVVIASPVIPELCHQLQAVTEDKVKLRNNELMAREEIAFLQNELGRLNDEMIRERTNHQSISGENAGRIQTLLVRAQELETSDVGQYELINVQRRLLHEKDEEIRYLSELVGAYKEQGNIYYDYLDAEERANSYNDIQDSYPKPEIRPYVPPPPPAPLPAPIPRPVISRPPPPPPRPEIVHIEPVRPRPPVVRPAPVIPTPAPRIPLPTPAPRPLPMPPVQPRIPLPTVVRDDAEEF
jgi:hypothetical protein